VLGVGPRQRLVVVGARGTGAGHAGLLAWLSAGLPPEWYRIIALFSPGPGPRETGVAEGLRYGVSAMPPEGDWRAALVAADWIIDDGAIGPYGAITGVPVFLCDVQNTDPGSALAELALVAPRLAPHRPIAAQLNEATSRHRPDDYRSVRERITSEPGRFNRNMRSLIYRRLGLGQPLSIPTTDPVSPPFRID
jgi:hypothetical protein